MIISYGMSHIWIPTVIIFSFGSVTVNHGIIILIFPSAINKHSWAELEQPFKIKIIFEIREESPFKETFLPPLCFPSSESGTFKNVFRFGMRGYKLLPNLANSVNLQKFVFTLG